MSRCVACRQSKIKCSGEEPCANCQRRYVKCQFEECGNKITVSQRFVLPNAELYPHWGRAECSVVLTFNRYLRGLKSQVNDGRRRLSTPCHTKSPPVEARPTARCSFSPSGPIRDDSSYDALSSTEFDNHATSSPHKQHMPDDIAPVSVDEAYSIWTSPFSYPTTTQRVKYKNKRNWSK